MLNSIRYKNSKTTLSIGVRLSHSQAGKMKEKPGNAEVFVVAFSNSGYVRCICLVMPLRCISLPLTGRHDVKH
jgi:hypothetical protein